MKPLALNLSRMKKISGDGKSSTFLHPDGHKMVIAHGAVSALQKKQLEQMPVQKFASGGDVKDVDLDAPKDVDLSSTPAPAAAPGNFIDRNIPAENASLSPLPANNQPGAVPIDDANADTMQITPGPLLASNNPGMPDSIPASSPESAVAQPSATVQSMGLPTGGADIQGAYQQGQRGITEEQNVQAAKAKADADIQTKDLADRQAFAQGVKDSFSHFSDQQQQLIKDYQNNHIDPKHYVENMGAGQKIATGIGLLLGSFGSGSNQAMDFLNKQIDRDIDAQRSRIDQQKTLLGANADLYHDSVLYNNQTRVNMNDIYDHKIQLAASQLGTPQAKAAADMAHSKFALENAGLLQKNAFRAGVIQHLQNGGTGLNAIDLAHAEMIPQEEAIKEQGSIDSQRKALASAGDIFKKYDQEQTIGNLGNPESARRVSGINAELTNLIIESDASKRLTPESAELEVKPFWVNTSDTQETRQSKLNGIANLVRQHAAPTPYMSHYSPQSLPQYGEQQAQHPKEGKTGTLPNGQRIIMRGGKIVPIND